MNSLKEKFDNLIYEIRRPRIIRLDELRWQSDVESAANELWREIEIYISQINDNPNDKGVLP